MRITRRNIRSRPRRFRIFDATLAEIAAYSGPDRIAKLVTGAKKEGAVNVYTSETIEDIGALSQAFEAKYGVKLKLWRGSSEDILQRAVVEARGGRFDADAFETGATAMESLHRESLLQQVDLPAAADLAPEAIQPHHEWIGTRYNIFVAAYNTRLIAGTDLPKSYDDLADPNGRVSSGSRPMTATGSARWSRRSVRSAA